MGHQRAVIFSGAVALSSLFAGADVAAGAAGAAAPAGPTTTSSNPGIVLQTGHLQRHAQTATVRTATTEVNGKSESILVDTQGLPLYYHRGDTAKKSMVTGELARLWPPLVSANPTGTGIRGKVTALKTANAHLVTFNGRFLYTFVDDAPGHVTGQGVSDFFVATPQLKSLVRTTLAPISSGRSGYGY